MHCGLIFTNWRRHRHLERLSIFTLNCQSETCLCLCLGFSYHGHITYNMRKNIDFKDLMYYFDIKQNLFLAAFCYTIPTCILRKRATIFHICIINAECWTEENYDYFILLYNFKEEYYYLLKELVIIIYLYILYGGLVNWQLFLCVLFLCNVEWVKKIQYRCDMNIKVPKIMINCLDFWCWDLFKIWNEAKTTEWVSLSKIDIFSVKRKYSLT